MPFSTRQRLGAALIDWPSYELGLWGDWTRICNRRERLLPAPDGIGVACDWRSTTDLHAAMVFPPLGRRLMRRALQRWPVAFAHSRPQIPQPQVSFVIGHRGTTRAPLLMATLASIAAQQQVDVECIVVEQSPGEQVRDLLPPWVRYLHTPPAEREAQYSRSWALNCGARAARGRLLVLHDGDMLVPNRYAAELYHRFEAGYAVIDLKRFVFYLTEGETAATLERRAIELNAECEAVVQNLQAGGSLAVGRDQFFEVGGFDESFRGWGGEDNEFYERITTLPVWPFAYLPLVHLWHAAQPGKADKANPNLTRYRARSIVPPAARIAKLALRDFGNPARDLGVALDEGD